MARKEGEGVSNVIWGLAIGAIILVDITQIILNLFAVGLVVNRYIDIFVAMTILLCCRLAKIELTKERLLSIIAVFVAEEIPVLDVMPFWTGDILYIFASVKKEEILKKLGPVAGYAKMALDAKDKIKNLASKADEIANDFAEDGIEGVAKKAADGEISSDRGESRMASPMNVIDLRGATSTVAQAPTLNNPGTTSFQSRKSTLPQTNTSEGKIDQVA